MSEGQTEIPAPGSWPDLELACVQRTAKTRNNLGINHNYGTTSSTDVNNYVIVPRFRGSSTDNLKIAVL